MKFLSIIHFLEGLTVEEKEAYTTVAILLFIVCGSILAWGILYAMKGMERNSRKNKIRIRKYDIDEIEIIEAIIDDDDEYYD